MSTTKSLIMSGTAAAAAVTSLALAGCSSMELHQVPIGQSSDWSHHTSVVSKSHNTPSSSSDTGFQLVAIMKNGDVVAIQSPVKPGTVLTYSCPTSRSVSDLVWDSKGNNVVGTNGGWDGCFGEGYITSPAPVQLP